MSETVIRNVAEFQTQLQTVEADETDFLYRGQADVNWKVECSASRRLNLDPTKPVENQLINPLLVGYLESRIERARKRNFLPPDFNEDSSDLELLAQLQYFGAATGLIDFTTAPLIALWFACNESHAKDGAVFLLPRSATKKVDNSSDLKEKIQSFYEKDEIWLWEPPPRGHRIGAQNSVFVLGVPVISRAAMRKLTVPAESKPDILTHLEDLCNINEEELFPDFPGYAVSNASNKTYDVSRSVSYWNERIGLAHDDSARAKAHYRCGVAFSAIKNARKAIEQYSAAIELKPDARAYGNRGLAKADLNQRDKALADYDRAISLNPQYAIAYNNRGSVKEEMGLHEEAIADFDSALSINPNLAGCYANRGSANTKLKRYEDAIQDYDSAIRVDPEWAEAYCGRGMTRIDQEKYAEAVADFDAAIAIRPDYADAFINRGAAKSWLRRHKEAIADFSEALRIQPHDAEAYYNRGATMAIIGLHEEAIADFDAAIALDPKHAKAFNSRGATRAKIGHFKEAETDFSTAIGINPKYDEAYFNRGLARKSLGQLSAAAEDFEKARLLAGKQGNADLLKILDRELDDLKSRDPSAPPFFQVVPHRSGYVEGIHPGMLKELLCDMDDDRFIEKSAQ